MRLKLYHVIFIFFCVITCHCTRDDDDYCERDEHGSCKKTHGMTCDPDGEEPCFFEEEEEEIPVLLHSSTDSKQRSGDDNYPEFPYLTRFDVGSKKVCNFHRE